MTTDLYENIASPFFEEFYTSSFLFEWKLFIIHALIIVFYFLMLVPPLALVGRQINLIRPFLRIGYFLLVEIFLVLCYKVIRFPIENPSSGNILISLLFLLALHFALIGYMKLYQQYVHFIESRVLQRRLDYFIALPVAAA